MQFQARFAGTGEEIGDRDQDRSDYALDGDLVHFVK